MVSKEKRDRWKGKAILQDLPTGNKLDQDWHSVAHGLCKVLKQSTVSNRQPQYFHFDTECFQSKQILLDMVEVEVQLLLEYIQLLWEYSKL